MYFKKYKQLETFQTTLEKDFYSSGDLFANFDLNFILHLQNY